MKNINLVLCLIFLSCAFISAQTPPVENWQTFAPIAEEFSIEVPASLSPTDFGGIRNFGGNDLKVSSRRYQNNFDGAYFFVFSDSRKNLFQTKVVEDFVKDFQKSGKSFPVGNLTGEKFTFADNEDFYHTILFVKTNRRSYVFHAVSPTENNPRVERFFATVQIKPDNSVKPENDSATEKSVANETLIVENQSQTGSGQSGNDKGISPGYGRNSAVNNDANFKSPSAQIQTKDLTIQSKPRAAFTSLARFYQITGTVRTRITFLANGEIGDITPVTKLPFGLTNQALIAAKSIKFEPAIRNGQPVNISKQVEYSFTIY